MLTYRPMPPIVRLVALAASVAAVPGCVGSCGDNSARAVDAATSDGIAPGDGGPRIDAATPLTAVDFAVGGCVDTSGGCAGPSPLALQLSPIAAAPIDVYLWSFGDGATSSEAAPRHVYRDPGTYSLSLDVEGPGGAIGITKVDLITVTPAELASPCERDEQCASGLCVCGEGDGACPPALAGRGFCSADCEVDACAEGICVDLAPSDPVSPQDWQRALCLPDCSAGSCGGDLVCRSLRAAGSADWERACFSAGVLGDIGDSCADAGGVPDSARCASGLCLGEGARGLCAHDCASAECPEGTECASFAGPLGDQCLRPCDAGFACDADPWLGCEDPGGTGPQSFTVAGGAAPGGYCAPKSCGAPADCGTDGQCTMGYCGP